MRVYVVKVHYDDPPPYYTISIDGQERSTVRTKLEPFTQSAEPALPVPVQPVPAEPMPVIVDAIQVGILHDPDYDPNYRAVAGASSSSSLPLVQMVDLLKTQLGIDSSAILADAVDHACEQLGVSNKGSLIERATECWEAIGSPLPDNTKGM